MEKILETSFELSAAHVTENMSLDNSVDPIDYKVVTEQSKIIIDSGITLTIASGKTLIPNLNYHP
jgi:hypothetical protein